jgi:hypothetical protein
MSVATDFLTKAFKQNIVKWVTVMDVQIFNTTFVHFLMCFDLQVVPLISTVALHHVPTDCI